MAKKMMAIIVVLLLSVGLVLSQVSKATTAQKKTIVEATVDQRQRQIDEEFEVIHQKVDEKVTAKLAEKISANEANASPENVAEVLEDEDVTTSASQNGRERGRRNREFGERLSDPNLSQEERQQIIQEKKEYNQGNH